VAEIGRCRAPNNSGKSIEAQLVTYKEFRTKSMQCMSVYMPLVANSQICNLTAKALKETIGSTCKGLKPKPPFSTAPCIPKTGNTTGTWLKRVRDAWKEKYTSHVKLQSTCGNMTKMLTANLEECAKAEKARAEKGKECLELFNKMKAVACSMKEGLGQACTKSAACYKEKVSAYSKLKDSTQKLVDSWQPEWRRLTALDCLMNSQDPATGSPNKMQEEECKSKRMGSLKVIYPAIPSSSKCNDAELPSIVDRNLTKSCGKSTSLAEIR